MKYRTLGSSGLEVSVMAFGAWQIGDPAYWGPEPEADAQAAVDAAIDVGINLFDTAELYGNGASEEALGRALGAKRDSVLIASKARCEYCAPQQLRAACEQSLQRLGTDRIDLYQIHWPSREVPFEDTFGELARLREEGKIRAIGVSNFGHLDLDTWVACGECASDQLGYNILFRVIEQEIVPACQQHNVGILVYMPLFQGILSGRWESVEAIPPKRRRMRHFASTREGTRHGEPGCEALLLDALDQLRGVASELDIPMATVVLAWTMAQPAITSVIVGARNPRQLIRNTDASDLELDAATLARLNDITDPLKRHFGSNADMWCGSQDSRIR